jgi:hypothetical protein
MNKLLFCSLSYVKVWYGLWIILALLSYALTIFFNGRVESLNTFNMLVLNTIILITSFLYYQASSYLVKAFNESRSSRKSYFKRLSVIFFVLFVFDVISLFRGGFRDSLKLASSTALEIIPKENFFFPLYQKIYLYIPAAFKFLKPGLEGVSLLILAVMFAALSFKSNEADPV